MPDRPDQPDRRARLEWLLPPILAVLAIGLQFAIDVPHHEMLVREPKDDVTDTEKPEKSTTASRTPRPWRARGAKYIQRLRKSWSSKPIADEPIDPRFAEHHEELLRAIVRKAEAAVMPIDEPETVSTEAVCHTIRCELELCAEPEVAAGVVERLPNFKVGGRSLWHELREVKSDKPSTDEQTCHRYVIDFAVEGADPRNLRLVL